MSMMKITVIVCTCNRSGSLGKTLDNLVVSKLPESVHWEVLVVDNNSTDHTREVAEGFCRRFPGLFRYTFEPQPGKSFALNRGIREAFGDVLAFLDDDVTVDQTWLQNLTAPLGNGKWSGTGGRTLLAQAFSPPRWMKLEEPYNMGGVLAGMFDLGEQPCELDRAPYGSNMAFRKEMFEKYGLFRTDLGPSPNRDIPRANEDTEFGRRLMAGGERLHYVPSAVVYHPVLKERIEKSYFLAWYFDCGRAMVHEWPQGPDVLGISRRWFTFFKLIGTSFPTRVLLWTVTLNPHQRFFRKCWLWRTAGQIVEIYRQCHNAREQAIN